MAFDATLETTSSGIAKITLSGELDGATAPAFKAKVEAAAAANPQRLVLLMQDLEYMASAGLRVLIFSKQKMGTSVDIYLVGVQEMVLDTIKKTGFDRSVYIIDEYDGEQSTINEQEISSFQANLETTSSGIAKITLSGELDGATAPAFKAKVEAAAAANPQRLVLLMQDLEYMASAGLRVLIFSKQKMGTSVDIYLVGVQEMVLDTIKKTGFDRSVYIIDEYDAEQIENL